MSLSRIWKMLRKDLKLGPRSPFFLYALVLPVVLTVIFQFAFGALFEPRLRLGVVDAGNSAVVTKVRELEGIEVTEPDDVTDLRRQVEAHDLDAGLVLPAGFDAAVAQGERPALEFFVSGESLASNRIVLAVTALDLIRDLEGEPPPVDVQIVNIGEEALPLSVRLIPVIMFYALVLAGVTVPAASLVDEKEKGTLTAVLVTPAKISEVLIAKWALGVVLASSMSMVTLTLNGAIGPRPAEVLLVVLVAAILTSSLGLLVGVVSKNSAMMLGVIKGVGFVLFAPALWYIFPEWPSWIAKLFPLYWIIDPVWHVSIMRAPVTDVLPELAVATGITFALLGLVVVLARKMQAQTSTG
ncbi:MAG: ABC transporter permease [Actinobacteria bacterium]|nr:ABC transporter permease [Actinomycetota bacterium]